MTKRTKIGRVLHSTVDPTVEIDGHPIPALTTMLHRVCENDATKFEEAIRLISLFITEACNDDTH